MLLTYISLTKSISSLKVDNPKQQVAKKFMALSTPRCQSLELNDDMPKHVFKDLSPIQISQNTFDTLKPQHTSIPSDPEIDSMLSAPPPWKLQGDRPVDTPQTVGYHAFVTLCLP
jgi:hypothetical protein